MAGRKSELVIKSCEPPHGAENNLFRQNLCIQDQEEDKAGLQSAYIANEKLTEPVQISNVNTSPLASNSVTNTEVLECHFKTLPLTNTELEDVYMGPGITASYII